MNSTIAMYQMKAKLAESGLPFQQITVFGAIRINVHVTCASRATADRWAYLLAQVFHVAPTVTRHMWNAKENHGTCLRPTKRQGWLVGVTS